MYCTCHVLTACVYLYLSHSPFSVVLRFIALHELLGLAETITIRKADWPMFLMQGSPMYAARLNQILWITIH